MKLKVLLSCCAIAVASIVMAAEKVATEGAVLGQWTMDLPAAQALAKETGKPIFMNFTGSDWCGWCKMMDRNVFSQTEWKDYAKDNLVLLWVDFPKNKALVPEAFVERNRALAQQYNVSGYPTYIVVGADGKTALGQLGAEPEAKPAEFIQKVERTLLVARLDKLLSAEDYAAWTAVEKEIEAFAIEVNEWQKKQAEEGKAFQVKYKALETRREALLDKAIKTIQE